MHDDSFVEDYPVVFVLMYRIIEFVTDGPKNYAYKIARPDKDGNTTICKVKGITSQLQELLDHQL
jgi:hypothetical protein